MAILGIDPGFSFTGYAVVKKEGNKTFMLDYGYFKLPQSKSLVERVALFHDAVETKIKTFQVVELAIETPFLGKNAQNFLKLGYLRGILYLLASRHSLYLHEFTPMQVKQSLTGFGGASKEQVSRVLYSLFPAITHADKFDATDALAISLCGLWQNKSLQNLYKN